MRTLAQDLGSGTATLYRHFPNRGVLIAEMGEHVLGEALELAGDLEGMPWMDAWRSLARALFQAARARQNVAPLLIEQFPVGPQAMTLRERAIAVLMSSGFSPQLATRAYATLARYVLGFALQAGQGDGDLKMESERLSHVFDDTQFPATRAVANLLPVPLQEEFEFGLDLMLRGLMHRVREES